MNDMKWIFTILLFATVSFSGFSKNSKEAQSKAELIGVINDLKGADGVDIVNLGPLAKTALVSTLRFALMQDKDEDTEKVMKVLNGLKRIAIVDFSECDQKVRSEMNLRIKKALKRSDLLTEVKDDGSRLMMYGIVDEKTSTIKDFVLTSDEDCVLICLFGSISADILSNLTAN